jgi:hypothetical protein
MMSEEKREKRKSVDPMFDGHLEKPISKMTPREKIYYIWLCMKFKYDIKDRVIIKKKTD